MNRKLENFITRSKNRPMLEREQDGVDMVTFSLSSLTSTASWERDGVLTT